MCCVCPWGLKVVNVLCLSLRTESVNVLCLSLRTGIVKTPFSYMRFFFCVTTQKVCCFLKHDAVCSGRILPALQRNLLKGKWSGRLLERQSESQEISHVLWKAKFHYVRTMHSYAIRSPLYYNATCHSNMFRSLKGHLQGVLFIHSSSMGNKRSHQM